VILGRFLCGSFLLGGFEFSKCGAPRWCYFFEVLSGVIHSPQTPVDGAFRVSGRTEKEGHGLKPPDDPPNFHILISTIVNFCEHSKTLKEVTCESLGGHGVWSEPALV